jgi:hypothetical protein|tara:strand:+ start:362 stop:553 length:192 start_codon:yes stop_codon:yes gene_type:complete
MAKLIRTRTRTGRSGVDYYRYGIGLSSSFIDDMGWVDKDVEFDLMPTGDGFIVKVISISDKDK